jgi:hypothetical protein
LNANSNSISDLAQAKVIVLKKEELTRNIHSTREQLEIYAPDGNEQLQGAISKLNGNIEYLTQITNSTESLSIEECKSALDSCTAILDTAIREERNISSEEKHYSGEAKGKAYILKQATDAWQVLSNNSTRLDHQSPILTYLMKQIIYLKNLNDKKQHCKAWNQKLVLQI